MYDEDAARRELSEFSADAVREADNCRKEGLDHVVGRIAELELEVGMLRGKIQHIERIIEGRG